MWQQIRESLDRRLWHTDGWRRRRVANHQIIDAGKSGLYYDSLEGVIRVLDTDSHEQGRVVSLEDAAWRLGVEPWQVYRWLKENNAALRCEYEGTD